jgi:hypothetical protein
VFSQHRGKFLQLHLTIEDEGVFTVPWTATLTYVPARNNQLPEDVCAENMQFYCGQAGFLKTAGDSFGCAPWKGGAFQWVQVPPGNRSSRKQPEQSWR